MLEPTLDSREQEAVYKVLEAINSDIDWRGLFSDNLCTGGPHGVICDLDAHHSKRHIMELNLGWVFDTANNPPGGINASFSPYLVSILRLRKLFFYRCFIPAFVWVQSIRCSLSFGVIGLKDSFCSLRPAKFYSGTYLDSFRLFYNILLQYFLPFYMS